MTPDALARRYAAGVTTLLDWCENHPTSHGAEACARIALATYNASDWPLSLNYVWGLDGAPREAALDVINGYLILRRESHVFGEEARIRDLWRALRPQDFTGRRSQEAAR